MRALLITTVHLADGRGALGEIYSELDSRSRWDAIAGLVASHCGCDPTDIGCSEDDEILIGAEVVARTTRRLSTAFSPRNSESC